jgi:hypothetical protein
LRDHPTLPGAARRDVTAHRQRRQRQTGLEYGVAGAPLVEPIELPPSQERAPRRHQNRHDSERYLPALHNASFSPRERRRIAASRFKALLRSAIVSW